MVLQVLQELLLIIYMWRLEHKNKNDKNMVKEIYTRSIWKLEFLILILLVAILIWFLSFLSLPVNGGVGNNVTVKTYLTVGNVGPEVLSVSIDNDATSVILIANSTKLVNCEALVRDWNNDSDISTVIAEFFNSSFGLVDDNNNHYTNNNCSINRTFGTWHGVSDTNYTALANCSFFVWYYANPGDWNCTVTVNDSLNWNASGSDNISVAELLAISLPTDINYGTVNSTYVSNENITNVTNVGNVKINLSSSGYAFNESDGLAMNCTLGSIKNISIYYEKFNLTTSTAGTLSLTQFEGNYVNLTSSPVVKRFSLDYRQNDTINEATNSTYWRIYVPLGVAGTCQGNIVFGATKATGS